MNRGTGWKRLTSRDLKHFDDNATNAVLMAMEYGGIGKINSNGHAFIRAPGGTGTMSVTRDISSKPNDLKNTQADLRRLFPELRVTGSGATKKKADTSMNSEPSTPTFTVPTPAVMGAPNGIISSETMLTCPAKGCDKEFVTGGARYKHITDDHSTCTWEGADVNHADPNYRCDLGPDGTPFVGASVQSVAGHVNIQHKGNKPWLKRDQSPEALAAAGKKAAETKARKAKKAAAPVVESAATPVAALPEEKIPPARNVMARNTDTSSVEHRGVPLSEVKHRPTKPTTPAAKLAAIRAILGEDPRVAKLQAEVEELKAHLDLVREALNLDKPSKK